MAKKTETNTIEDYFQWWLNQMQQAGYIKYYKREPETISVIGPATYGRYKRFKRKEKEVEDFNLFNQITYTYDYIIVWATTAEYLFYEEVLEGSIFSFGKPVFIAHQSVLKEGFPPEVVSYVDVKPISAVQQKGGKVSSAVSFPIKQRIIWERYRRYINKVIPIPMAGAGYTVALFCKTFVPQRYLLTDGGGQQRRIRFPIQSMEQYVLKRKTYIENLLKNTYSAKQK